MADHRRRLDFFLNVAHTLDHLLLLIFPTVVLAIATEWNRSYSELLPLATGAFFAFGAGSIPSGWIADRWSRSGMIAVFFFGIGASTMLTGFADGPVTLAIGLTLIGVFASIYHPVGIAMLVSGKENVGKTLGVNGVYGNAGLAFAALVSGALADLISWRAAFIVPGLVTIALGFAFLAFARKEAPTVVAVRKTEVRLPRAFLARVFIVLCVAVVANGIIFNALTVSMPKVFDERLKALTDTTFGIGLLVCITYLIAAMAQLAVGHLIDRRPIKGVFVVVLIAQVPLLYAAATLANLGMLVVATAMMFAVFGQIPINDAMVARYTAEEWRARAYAVRYVVSFVGSASAVPLVAYVFRVTGDFQALYLLLAGLAAVALVAALAFPGERATAAVAPAVR
jgi:MFS family permease